MSRSSALEGNLVALNLDFYSPEINAEGLQPVTAELNRELVKMGLSGIQSGFNRRMAG